MWIDLYTIALIFHIGYILETPVILFPISYTL